jgi:acetyl-CoA carboxylase biotin carboxyl carrier protein
MTNKVGRKELHLKNLDEIKEIIELAQDHNLSEFEIEKEGVRLRIKREGSHDQGDVTAVPVPAPALITAQPAESSVGTDVDGSADLSVVKSPIVGTFYRAPDPEAKPFVQVGDKVGKGQVLCIIEAMKLMNEINAEDDGEITEIFVENGQSVQYGDKLFSMRVRPRVS